MEGGIPKDRIHTQSEENPLMTRTLIPAVLALALALAPAAAFAHCDTMDGPVVQAARAALAAGDVKPALIWVQKEDEPAITQAFQRTLAVRRLSPAAQELADTYFFETLVRVHRAGEGEPTTGLKPAGTDLGPMVPMADRAIAAGDVAPLLEHLTEAVHHGVRERFDLAMARRDHAKGDVAAGRAYVQAYVPFLHYIERVHAAIAGGGEEHGHAGGVPPGHP